MKKKIAIGIWGILLCLGAWGQTRAIDSLRNVILTSSDKEQKLSAILDLNDQAANADSLLPYIKMAEQIAATSSDPHIRDKVAFCRAAYYARKNQLDSGMTIINHLIAEYRNKKGEEREFVRFLFFRSKLSDRGNHYSRSLSELYEVVEAAQDIGDTLTLIHAKTGIGWVLIEMEQYHDALKWLHDAQRTSADKNFYRNYGALYSNMAMAFNGLGNKDSSLFYISKAIKDARQNENLLFLATALSMQAKIFVDNNMSPMAEAPLHEVLNIRKQLNDPFYVVFDMSNLATYYAKNGQPEKGLALCREGIAIAKQMRLPSQLMMIYRALAENYRAAGDEQQYGKTLEEIISLKDSFNNINSAKLLTEMQAANEARKQEKTITEQRLNLAIKNYFLFGSVIFAIMAFIIGWLAFKNYKRKQKLKMEVAIEKEKLLSAQAVKDAGEQERRRIAADLHDNLGAQANAILYSTELLQQEQQPMPLVTDLHHTAKDMLTSLRETLWVLKNTEVTAADVWLRIINFTKQMNRHYPDLKISTEGIAPAQLPLSSAKALNLVFIAQEAVNNAIRHANAENIAVNSAFSDTQWTIEVRDDGEGFDHEAARKKQESYGLSNMSQRAAAAGFVLEIDSHLKQGTSIALVLPMPVDNPKGVLEKA